MQSDTDSAAQGLSSFIIAAAVVVGISFPSIANAFFPYIFTALFFIVVFSLNTMDERPTLVATKIDGLLGAIVGWQLFALPAIAMLGCALFGAPLIITTVLLATTTAGSVFASPTLAQLMGLNRQLAMRAMVLTTAAMPFSLLFFGELSGVLPPDLSFTHYFLQIFYYLITPLAISFIYWEFRQYISSRARKTLEEGMKGGALAAVLVFCIGVMAKLHSADPAHVQQLLFYAFFAAAAPMAMYILTILTFARLGRHTSSTLAMLAANRNVALSFALLHSVFPPNIMLFVAVSQFPIFLSPLVIRLAQLLRRRWRRTFG
ncbi:MAG: hypothetical protein KTR21_13400 [Rhodobacteraceae bacterium]|nr:hypothetical protein [Paracoccaceae bacterium]